MGDGRLVRGGEGGLLGALASSLSRRRRRQPSVRAASAGRQRRVQRLEGPADVRGEPVGERPVPAEVAAVGVDHHDPRVFAEHRRLAVAETEIERRAEHEDHVRLAEGRGRAPAGTPSGGRAAGIRVPCRSGTPARPRARPAGRARPTRRPSRRRSPRRRPAARRPRGARRRGRWRPRSGAGRPRGPGPAGRASRSSTVDMRRSTAISTKTGPGWPDSATSIARARYSGMSRGSGTAQAPFVMGRRSETWSISWRAPRPLSPSGEPPPMRRSGLRAAWAFATPVTASVTPGPGTTTATPSPRVRRAHASAACAAACSWRTSIDPDAVTEAGVVDRQDVAAAEREDGAHALAGEDARDQLAAGQVRHGTAEDGSARPSRAPGRTSVPKRSSCSSTRSARHREVDARRSARRPRRTRRAAPRTPSGGPSRQYFRARSSNGWLYWCSR